MNETMHRAGDDQFGDLRQDSDPVTATATETPAEHISKDELFHLLQNYRRRAVVRYLEGTTDPVRMRDVAEQVAAWEHDTTVGALTSKQRQRVYIALYQSHLETLADAGVIEYNKPRGIVEPTPLLDRVAAYTDPNTGSPDSNDDIEWERRYLGVSIVSSLLLVGAAIDLTIFDLVSTFAVSILILAMFSILTLLKLFVGHPTERSIRPS